MSQVSTVLSNGNTISLGVDYDVDETGRLLILDKVRTDHTARDIATVPNGEWVWVQVNGLDA